MRPYQAGTNIFNAPGLSVDSQMTCLYNTYPIGQAYSDYMIALPLMMVLTG